MVVSFCLSTIFVWPLSCGPTRASVVACDNTTVWRGGGDGWLLAYLPTYATGGKSLEVEQYIILIAICSRLPLLAY